MTRQIIVADDHPLLREALKAAVGRLDPSASGAGLAIFANALRGC